MLAQEEYVEVHALRRRGWSISAIARHVGRDRKTVRAHLTGEHVPGRRRPAESDPFDTFGAYVGQRLADDPHLWATALFDEVTGLGYGQSYPTFVRKIRNLRLRPSCGACAGTRGRPVAIIDHPPGEECQWDWVEVGGHTVGVDSVRAGGCPVPFGEVPSVDQQPPGPGSSGGGHRRGAATLRGHRPAVAGRSHGHRRGPGHRPHTAIVCGSGETLRGGDRRLPTEATEPQRRGGESDPLSVPALVAHR